MGKTVQFKRGTDLEHRGYIGAFGEVTVDTTNMELRIHDGVTLGGLRQNKGVLPPKNHSSGYVPLWDGENTSKLQAGLPVGNVGGGLVKLDKEAKLPALDGTNLTGIDHNNLTNKGNYSHIEIDSHLSSKSNPHEVTFKQILPIMESGKILSNDGDKLLWVRNLSGSGVGLVDPPVTSISYGEKGQIAVDSKYLYVCVDTSLWSKVPIILNW